MAGQTVKNEVSKIEGASANYMVNGEEVKLSFATVKNYLVRGNVAVSDQEVVMFINWCKFEKLNPWLNEAYLVKYDSAKPAQNVTGKVAFMKRAEEHPMYDGYKAGLIIGRDGEVVEEEGSFSLKGDVVLGAWAEVYRKDRAHPIRERVSMEEYNLGQSTWKSKPKTMIRKVALVHALREAFPLQLADMYVDEEIEDAVVIDDKQEAKKKEANSKPLKFQEDKPPVEEIQDAQIISEAVNVDEEPGF